MRSWILRRLQLIWIGAIWDGVEGTVDGNEHLKKIFMLILCSYSAGVLVEIRCFLRCPGQQKPTTYILIVLVIGTIHHLDPLPDQFLSVST